MDTNEPKPMRRYRRQVLVMFAVAMAIASLGSAAWTLALFTDTAASASNDFTAGTIDVAVSPATALFSVPVMMPGDTSTSALTVTNSGTGSLRYAMTTSATNPDTKALRDQIVLVVKTKDTNTAGCGNFNGTQLYTGSLAAAFFGSTVQGDQAGDRTLAGAANEILCFNATLPSATGNGFQGATTVASFTFSAEQTANNP